MMTLLGGSGRSGGEDVAGRLFDEVPEAFFAHFLRAAKIGYRDAEKLSMDFLRPEAHDLIGDMRRGRCEESLVYAAEYAGLKCLAKRNRRRTSYHRLVICGRYLFVQCHHARADEVVRDALHREDYASLAQGSLETGFDLDVPIDDVVFGIIQHGAHPKAVGEMAYCVVNFPDAKVDTYKTSVELLKRFSEGPIAGETRLPKDLNLKPRRQSETGNE